MNLLDLLPLLKPYTAILVTGAQRSGTTIGARMIAQELGYRYVDENEFGIHNPYRAYEQMKQGNVVLHAPALCHIVDKFTYRLNYCVVLMRRPLDEIHASEQRIHWREAYDGANLLAEQQKYSERFGIYGDNIAAIKYFCWEYYQKSILKDRAFELEYASLKAHPLWVSERAEFGVRQYAVQE